jgi:cobalt/nickel transport system permease protein
MTVSTTTKPLATPIQGVQPAPKRARPSWLEKTVAGIAESIERAVFTEEHARRDGYLQKIDPRAKLVMFVALVLSASLTGSLLALALLYIVILAAARASKVPFDFFVRRVWLGIPFFAGIVVIPSLFFTPGDRLFGWSFGLSIPGLIGGAILVARVGVSVSLGVLLVLVTPWADVLKSLQAFKVPQIFILLLSMTYRYIFLFLHSANGLFEARKSRQVGRSSGNEQRGWISGSMGSLMHRSFKMSNEVYTAMLARGFSGNVRSYNAYQMQGKDWLALAASVLVAVGAFVVGKLIG